MPGTGKDVVQIGALNVVQLIIFVRIVPKLGRGKREDKDGEKINNNKPNNNKPKGSYQGRKMENLKKAFQQVAPP
jgi:hypothetical protein